MYQKVTAGYVISANIVGTDLAPADWGAKIAFSPRTNQSAIRKAPEARLIVGFQLRSAAVSPPGEPGFSGISATEAGRSGQSFRVFPAATSQKDLECGIFRICVRAELIESPINLAALTSGRRWHTRARNTHEWLLPFVSFRAKPNPALPAAGKKKRKKKEKERIGSLRSVPIHFSISRCFIGKALPERSQGREQKHGRFRSKKESNCGIILQQTQSEQ